MKKYITLLMFSLTLLSTNPVHALGAFKPNKDFDSDRNTSLNCKITYQTRFLQDAQNRICNDSNDYLDSLHFS